MIPDPTRLRRKRGDTHRPIKITLADPAFDATALDILFKVGIPKGALVVNRAPDAVSFVAGRGTTVELHPREDDAFVTTVGTYLVEVEVTYPDGTVETFPGGEIEAPLYLYLVVEPDLDDG